MNRPTTIPSTSKVTPTGDAPTPPRATKIGAMLADRVTHKTQRPTDPIAQQQAIENALSAALHLIRTGDSLEALQRATGRAVRAATMLKRACAESRAAQ
ncbi:MAG: hypothetical protein K9K38_07620 [Rhodoferax sp.]|nr:hypothetical protein [Rhodoferax sp.]